MFEKDSKLLSNKDIICRAKFKISELLSRSSVFKKFIENKHNIFALDIGASPGGWTFALSENVKYLDRI